MESKNQEGPENNENRESMDYSSLPQNTIPSNDEKEGGQLNNQMKMKMKKLNIYKFTPTSIFARKKRMFLSDFNYEFSPRSDQIVLRKNIGKMKRPYLSKLKTVASGISLGMKHCTKLKELEWTFQNEKFSTAWSEFCHNLKSLAFLQKITINIRKIVFLSHGEFSALSKAMRRLSSLKKIKVTIDSWGWTKITEEDLTKLFQTLKYHTSLQDLRLEIREGCNFTNTCLRTLSQILIKMQSLQILYLILPISLIAADSEFEGLGDCFKTLLNLKEIVLNFRHWTITDEGLSNLLKSLNNCCLLEKIYLNFTGNYNLTENRVLEILHLLQNNALSIKKFGLTTTGSQISEEGVAQIFQGTQQCPNLERIFLSYSEYLFGTSQRKNLSPITKKGFISICKSLDYASKLKHAYLDFQECPGITDDELCRLGQCLKSRESLETLTLCFHSCQEITDAGILLIAENLKDLPRLENILLEFTKCFKITPQGQKSLSACLHRFKSLDNCTFQKKK